MQTGLPKSAVLTPSDTPCSATAQAADVQSGGKALPAKAQATASFKKLEAQFGRRAAVQLTESADPRKDLVRQQGSRFKGVVEEERAAKRRRRLAELEVQDAAAEKMEAIMSMKVQAFRCADCYLTFDFEQTKVACEAKGHKVSRLEAQKTRWECRGCAFAASVLDRNLPDRCQRCNSADWKQVSLSRVRAAAPMEKDFFLARGEELPFLNSIHIPGMPGMKRFKEAREDYAGL